MNRILQQINDDILQNPFALIESAEQKYHHQITRISQTIADDDAIKIVCLAGPSGSGKTTSAHVLRQRLETLGEKTAVLSLDDFYLPREELPVLEDGTLDYETIYALDLPRLKKCFEEIIRYGKTTLPHFDFQKNQRFLQYSTIDVGHVGIVIVEGLHALNPLIVSLVDAKNIYKIYVSVNDGVADESGQMVLSSHHIRLARRMIRDEKFRAADPVMTLGLWEKVVIEERKHLYAYKKTADVCLVTLHSYEPCIYRYSITEMAKCVSEGVACYDFFMELANNILRFEPISPSLVPSNSLLREFIGNA
ncbi:MAG: nucleoside kinase [Clostridia bacterium]|nr:nucleoside kinase [Clostridia bacterium]